MTPLEKHYVAALREERRQAVGKGKSTDDIDAELARVGAQVDPASDPADPEYAIEPDAPALPDPDNVRGLREEHRGYVVRGLTDRAQAVADELARLGVDLYPPPVVVDDPAAAPVDPKAEEEPLVSLVETAAERKAREKAEAKAAEEVAAAE